MPLPIRVPLVALVHNSDEHMHAIRDLCDSTWQLVDVRRNLSKGPSVGGVGHTENGISPTAQVAVFSML